MKLFSFLKRSHKYLRIQRNVHSDSYICRSNIRFFHTINYAHLAHLVSRKRSNSEEVSSLHALLSTLLKGRQRENNQYSEVSIHKGHTCHIGSDQYEYKNLLTRWKELVKIYISWFPEITEDKYRSKCFSLPTYLVIHVVIPGSDTTETNTLQQFEEFNFDTLLKSVYGKGEDISDGNLHKYLPKEADHSHSNAKGENSPNGRESINDEGIHSLEEDNRGEDSNSGKNKSTRKKKKNDNSDNYDVHYVIGRNVDDAYNKIESVISKVDFSELGVHVKDRANGSNKWQACSGRNYFFSLNMLDLKDNEADRKILSRCMRGDFTETVAPVAKSQPSDDHHPHPFLFIVYDYKTLIHVFNNVKLEMPNIDSVFDVYILSSLLQLVQRGEKLQNVFSAYAAQSAGGILSTLNTTSILELPTVEFMRKCHFAIMPPEFSDVISGKYGIFGWGKYQKVKIKCERKKKGIRSTKKNSKDNLVISESQSHDDSTCTLSIAAQKISRVRQNHFSFTCADIKDQRSIKKLAFGNKRSLYEITEEDMISYCISRNCCMMVLFDFLMDIFAKNLNLLNIYVRIEQPLILCISEIERRGIFLNKKKIEEIHQSCSNPLVYKEEIEQLCECNINLNSSKQVASLIYGHLLDLTINPNVEVVTAIEDEVPHAESINYNNTIEGDNTGKPLSHMCDEFYHTQGAFEREGENIEGDTGNPQSQFYGDRNRGNTMREEAKLEESNLLRNIITNGNYPHFATEASVAIGTSEGTKPFPQLHNTINEMRRSKSLQTNNKTLKLIVDEIERNELIAEKEKEKMKKIINNVKLYRESKKLFQNYIENLPKFIQKETNKIHCNFNQVGASTGRLSCEHPNLQNIHSRFRCAISLKGEDSSSVEVGKDKLTVAEDPDREILTCEMSPHESTPSDGENLITFDYKQMELFVMAYLSFDRQLLKMLQSGDVFVETAKVLFNTTQVTSELRRMTKTVIYGILYGQTENGLARSLLISEGMASNLISNFFQVFPNVYRFMEMQKILLKHMNRVYTLVGRKRIIEPTVKNKYRISMNTPIQGCAADIMKFALLSCLSIMTHGRGRQVVSNFGSVHEPHNKYDVHSMGHWTQSARLLEINNVSAALLEENKPFLEATKLILQVHDELLFESTRRATAPIIRLISPILENAFYNLIHYTNTCDRLVLLYDYMHHNISVQTYIQYLQLSNNGQTWDSYSYGPNDRHCNWSNKLNSIFEEFNFMLPIKVETGDYYKEFS
ncbi:DNA polymerase 1, putative [Plasmodium knowlesi strain H]|uniref:DNA polymerase 1, putative n=3 Tax=Plasmodium knowlesi TaxID=5850 RepID=A0A5K1UT86_PLAKH|nr:DNA polymerase 1, putative [Plasmodium knowlesi strain H]OTN64529.1 putative DNA polymerase 1 [Plasmodium knowlesi]CAA9989073.1 DNA polymerase 1, putative [Plasmodium knowlesi strain H]SBO27286.1 DNA polymerase 1, putative [Plasmodium knowlesi strain H]SBO28913.1 DNA polymerase 1, putative [Plasmodium knowlesi strain H]VVS78547.1 DNA polymerase 1, putative [Plasmodium knowlesi strain H]|eukprot:XP_002261422.1 DNA polymerase I, putative [Plasmodium knowlesi strain H]